MACAGCSVDVQGCCESAALEAYKEIVMSAEVTGDLEADYSWVFTRREAPSASMMKTGQTITITFNDSGTYDISVGSLLNLFV